MKDSASLVVDCVSRDRGVSGAGLEVWSRLEVEGHRQLLRWSDPAGLTLHLWRAARGRGVGVREPIAELYRERLCQNGERLAGLRAECAQLFSQFRAAGLNPVLLKGFTLEPDFVTAAGDRVQYDFDFLFSPGQARQAFDLLRQCGRVSVGERDRADHLPPLVRPTGWQWQGNFFDVGIPAAVELHFRLWDPGFERIPVAFDGDPLSRAVECRGVPVLDDRDKLAHATLHVLRHLFRGSLRPSHLWEIAYFLDRHPRGDPFWTRWLGVNQPLRVFCAAGFLIAARAFGARIPLELTADTEALPRRAWLWSEAYARQTVCGSAHSKPEVFLHSCFLPRWSDRLVIAARRLFPTSLPGPVDAVHVPVSQLTWKRRLIRSARQARYVSARGAYHAVALASFARAAIRWWSATARHAPRVGPASSPARPIAPRVHTTTRGAAS